MKPISIKAAWRAFASGLAVMVVAPAAANDPPMLFGAEFEYAGYAAVELRGFANSPTFADQDDRRVEPSIILQPEARLYWERERVTFIPFYRYDPADTEGRTHGDVRELSLYVERDDWDLTAGLSKVFWGVAESRHLVDIVNQSDQVEDVDNEEKLGQPMLNANFLGDLGTLGVFVLPGFRERTFPGDAARLRGPIRVDTDNPIYESGAEEWHVDAALRYSHTIEEWDIGASYFHGTSREPELVQATNTGGETVLRPRYEIIDQVGLDIQATFDTWLWKFEGIHRSGHGTPFFATTAGLEYTFYGINDSATDLGIVAEYHYDGRKEDAPATFFDNDIFVAARVALNDAASTEMLGGFIIDQRNQEMLASFEAERRVTETWFAEAEARLFLNVDDGSLAPIEDESHLILRMTRYF